MISVYLLLDFLLGGALFLEFLDFLAVIAVLAVLDFLDFLELLEYPELLDLLEHPDYPLARGTSSLLIKHLEGVSLAL